MEKNCDWIISNDVSDKTIGFNSNFNEVTIFYKDKKNLDEKLYKKKKLVSPDQIFQWPGIIKIVLISNVNLFPLSHLKSKIMKNCII